MEFCEEREAKHVLVGSGSRVFVPLFACMDIMQTKNDGKTPALPRIILVLGSGRAAARRVGSRF